MVRGDFGEALRWMRRMLREGEGSPPLPQEATAHLNVARCYLYRGDMEECEKHLDQALDPHGQRQQVSQSRDLIVVPHKNRINSDRLAFETIVIALPAPVRPIVLDASLERNFGWRGSSRPSGSTARSCYRTRLKRLCSRGWPESRSASDTIGTGADGCSPTRLQSPGRARFRGTSASTIWSCCGALA